MRCIKCGAEMPDNSKFCPNCGEVVDTKIENIGETRNINYENAKNEPNGLSVTSLILGIASFVCIIINIYLALLCSILAIVFGAIGRKKGAKGIGTAGMVTGIVATGINVVIIFLAFIMVFYAFGAVTGL